MAIGPLSVASFGKAGINKPADLNGKNLGGSLGDGAYKLFPAYSKIAGVKADSVKWKYGDLRLSVNDVSEFQGGRRPQTFQINLGGPDPSPLSGPAQPQDG